MNYYIFTAIVALAVSKSKVQLKGNLTNKERKYNLDDKKIVVRKAS